MRIGFWLGSLTAFLAVMSASTPSIAQLPTSAVGEVLETDGPEGSTVVVRGSGVYSLGVGDTLFEGDRIFTRSNGTLKLRANGCERSMPIASSIEIGTSFCEEALVNLVETDVVEGVPVAAAPAAAPQATGATPGILALFASGAGAAAAAATSGSAAIN